MPVNTLPMECSITKNLKRIFLVSDKRWKPDHLASVRHWKPAKRALHSWDEYCHLFRGWTKAEDFTALNNV